MMETYSLKYTLDAKDALDKNEQLMAQSVELQQTIEETKKALKNATPGTDLYNVLIKDLVELKNKLEQINGTMEKHSKSTIVNFAAKGIKWFKDLIKMASKYFLALLGIRTALSVITKAFGSLRETNKQLRTDMEYINFALGQALEGVIKVIVDAVFWIMAEIGRLIKLIFGVNIYANATAEGFKKAKNNAKALKKELAGFDTIKNLEQPSGGSNLGTPSLDLADEVENSKSIVEKLDDWLEDIFTKFFTWIRDTVIKFDEWLEENLTILFEWIKKGFEVVGTVLGKIIDGVVFTIIGLFTGLGEAIGTLVDGIVNTIKELFTGLKKSVGKLWEGIKKIFSGDIKEGFKSIGKGIANVFITVLNTVLTAVNTVWQTILSLVDSVGSAFGKTWNLKTKLSIPKIPYLNVGTNFVPKDMMAVVHKGEAVVPKKFNNEKFLGSGNDETNYLLERLITTVESKEFKAYISAKDITNTAINGINQQNRIMGKSVIK